jgi:hypothetical protein
MNNLKSLYTIYTDMLNCTGTGMDEVNLAIKNMGGETIREAIEDYTSTDDNVVPRKILDK